MDARRLWSKLSGVTKRWTFLLLGIFGTVQSVHGDLELPEGWVERTPSMLGMHLWATHNDDGSILVLFEPVREFDVPNLEGFLTFKIDEFESRVGTGSRSEVRPSSIGGVEGLMQSLTVNLSTDNGNTVPARYQFHVCSYRGSYVTVMLGSATETWDSYQELYARVLRDLEF